MKQGFMLFELLISITLFIAIISISTAYIQLADSFLVKAEVDIFYTTSTYLWYRAQLERKDQLLLLDLSDNSYSSGAGQRQKLTKDIFFSACLEAKGPPAYPEKIIIKATSFVKNQIRFFADGSLQSGSLYFCNRAKDCLYAFTIPVSVAPCMRIYRYNRSAKKWHKENVGDR